MWWAAGGGTRWSRWSVPGNQAQAGGPERRDESARVGRVAGRSRTGGAQALGQHFLGSTQLAARLVADAEVGPTDRVVDLGAGTGVLTSALAARASAVLAVEIDRELVRAPGAAVRARRQRHGPARRRSRRPLAEQPVPRRRQPAVRAHGRDPAPAPRRPGRRARARRPRGAVAGRPPPGACLRRRAGRSARCDMGAVVAVRAGPALPRGPLPAPPVGRRRRARDHETRPARPPGRRVRALRELRPGALGGSASSDRRLGAEVPGEAVSRTGSVRLALATRECQHGLALGYPEC